MDDFTQNDFADMQQALTEDENSRQYTSKYWSPKADGITKIRLLPPLKQFKEKLFFERHRMHYLNGKPYFCLHQTLVDENGNVHESETCPICQKAQQLWKLSTSKESEESKIALTIGAKDRYVSRVIVRGNTNEKNEDAEATPVFYEYGKKIFGVLADAIKLGEVGNFLSMIKGRDLNLIKKGSGRNTDYSGTGLSLKETPIFSGENVKEKVQTINEQLPKLNYNQLVKFVSKEEIEAALREAFNEETSVQASAPTITVGEPVNTGIFQAKPEQTKVVETKQEESMDDESIESLIGQIDKGLI